MLASEIWAQINTNVRNFGSLKEQEAIYFINWAIDDVNEFLAASKAPETSVDLNVSDGMTVPENFLKFCGIFPVHTTGIGTTRVFKHDITNKPLIPIRYFAKYPRVNAMSDTVQFDAGISSIVILLASIYAINRAEGDTANDLAILQDRLSKAKVARGL